MSRVYDTFYYVKKIQNYKGDEGPIVSCLSHGLFIKVIREMIVGYSLDIYILRVIERSEI